MGAAAMAAAVSRPLEALPTDLVRKPARLSGSALCDDVLVLVMVLIQLLVIVVSAVALLLVLIVALLLVLIVVTLCLLLVLADATCLK